MNNCNLYTNNLQKLHMNISVSKDELTNLTIISMDREKLISLNVTIYHDIVRLHSHVTFDLCDWLWMADSLSPAHVWIAITLRLHFLCVLHLLFFESDRHLRLLWYTSIFVVFALLLEPGGAYGSLVLRVDTCVTVVAAQLHTALVDDHTGFVFLFSLRF